MPHSLRHCVTALLSLILVGTIARSQSVSGGIAGTVIDASGGVIPRPSVEVTNEGTGAERHLNHPNFSLPLVQRDGAFGALNQKPDVAAGNPRLDDGGPRVVQFGLKLIF